MSNNTAMNMSSHNNNISLAMSSSTSLASINKYPVTKQNNANGQQSEYRITHPTYSDPNQLSQMMYNQNNVTPTSYHSHPHPHPNQHQISQSHSFITPSPFNIQHGYNIANISYHSGTSTSGQPLQSTPNMIDIQNVSMKRDASYMQSTDSFSYPQTFPSQTQHYSTIKRTRFQS